jgi:hypothetical protein
MVSWEKKHFVTTVLQAFKKKSKGHQYGKQSASSAENFEFTLVFWSEKVHRINRTTENKLRPAQKI